MVSSQRAPVRSRRRAIPAGRVVAVTGAATPLGSLVVARLLGSSGVREVVGLGGRPRSARPTTSPTLPVPSGAASAAVRDGVTWRSSRTGGPDEAGLATALRGADVVVHAATALPPPDLGPQRDALVAEVRALLAAAASAGVGHVVLATSAMVYGALPSNAVPLPEGAPLQAAPDDSVVSVWLAVERLAAEASAARSLAVSVVRPAALVGPGVDTVITRHFEGTRLLVVRESRPHWQLCHVEDLAAALATVAVERLEGVLTVACEGWLEQDQVERLSGMARVEMPAAVAFATASRLHRLHVLPTAGSDLAYVVHPWVVSSARLLEAGWRPRFDNVTAFGVLLTELAAQDIAGGRRVGRRDATMGAAGAAVAVVGTAALVRAARRTRRP